MQSGQKCSTGDGKRKSLHPRLAGLLLDCEHEEHDAKVGRVAEAKISGIHLEAMEGAFSENTQSHKAGHIETLRPQMGIYESLLECSRKPDPNMLYYKRETRTSRIL